MQKPALAQSGSTRHASPFEAWHARTSSVHDAGLGFRDATSVNRERLDLAKGYRVPLIGYERVGPSR